MWVSVKVIHKDNDILQYLSPSDLAPLLLVFFRLLPMFLSHVYLEYINIACSCLAMDP